jgi:transcription antitermination protein NusB
MEPAPRHQARERAMTLLYEADIKGETPTAVMAELPAPPDPFTERLLQAAEDRADDVDRLIDEAAIDWQVDRMAVVDRTVLRLAVAELLECPETPTAVVLDEAVDLSSEYSTDASGRFVNGVLATVASQVRGGGAEES